MPGLPFCGKSGYSSFMSDIWDHYLEILSDPAHTLVEMTFIAVEFIVLSVVWAKIIKPSWAKMLDVWHHRLDREHGHDHNDRSNLPPSESMLLPTDNTPKKRKSKTGYHWRIPR